MTINTYADAIHHTLNAPRVEPVKRLVGGSYGWAIHRFPIKGGIPLHRVIADNVTRDNSLLRLLTDRNGSK